MTVLLGLTLAALLVGGGVRWAYAVLFGEETQLEAAKAALTDGGEG